MNQSQLEVMTCSAREAWENLCELSNWMKNWRVIVEPITERNSAKPKQM